MHSEARKKEGTLVEEQVERKTIRISHVLSETLQLFSS